MFRDQMINFLQAAVIFLLLTNAASAVAAAYAMRMAHALSQKARTTGNAVERRLDGLLRRPA